MDKFREKALTQFCAGLHIVMDDLSLMDTALTHSSYAYEVTKGTRPEFNQRLEFLGDSVLSLVVSTYLYQHYPAMDEGQLSKFRAFLVCEETLAELAQEMREKNITVVMLEPGKVARTAVIGSSLEELQQGRTIGLAEMAVDLDILLVPMPRCGFRVISSISHRHSQYQPDVCRNTKRLHCLRI